MVTLIITEKPNASKRIAQALAEKELKSFKHKKVTYYEFKRGGKKYLVGCAVGHLFALGEKSKTSGKYPIFDIEWKPSSSVSKGAEFTKNYLDTLSFLSKQADVFINACDYDTEGELIFKNILTLVCKRQNAKRMKFSTLTKEDLIKSFDDMAKRIDKPLALAGETRHFLDFLYGVNSSRALMEALKKTKKGYTVLSAGRVQSPTLEMLAKKEKEISKFKPKDFWQLFAHLNTRPKIILRHEKDRFFDQKKVKEIHRKCKNKKALVTKIKKNEFNSQAPAPFNVSSLQTESYRLFGFSPKRTLDIAQKLYVSAKTSYPRTSSEKLPPSIGYKKVLKALMRVPDVKKSAEELLTKKTLTPVEGKGVDPAHIAIYPTSSPPKSMASLSLDEKKIYLLIVKRFLACFADPARRETVTAEVDINKERFRIRGSRTLIEGWMKYYKPFIKRNDEEIPNLEEGKEYKVSKIDLKHDQTKPPHRYSQGSVITEMEKRGLGTRATRSGILQTLLDRNYIEGKSIEVTPLGLKITKILEDYVPDLVSEDLTKHFEDEMIKIREGKKKQDTILKEAKTILNKISKEFKEHEKKIGNALAKAYIETRDAANTLGECPKCKEGKLKVMYSKKIKAKFAGCSRYPDCEVIMNLPQGGLIKPTEKLCDSCKFPMIFFVRKGGRPNVLCFNPKCPIKKRKEREIKQQIEEFEKKEVKCPECKDGVLMVRKGMYGTFLGCSAFPKCRHTARIEKKDDKKKKFVKKKPVKTKK
jgi:DNA topoisomerase I